MKVNPILLLGTAQSDQLADSLTQELHQWVDDWFPEKDIPKVSVKAIKQTDLEQRGDVCAIKIAGDTAESWIVIDYTKSLAGEIGNHLLAINSDAGQRSDSDSTIVEHVVQEAMSALAGMLLQCSSHSHPIESEQLSDLLPTSVLGLGQGVVQCDIALSAFTLMCWMPLNAVASRIQVDTAETDHLPDLASTKSALARQTLKAQISLGDAELTLGLLSKLREGDVIQLDKPLDEPLSLSFEKSPVSFEGYLGQQQNQLVLRVDRVRD